jgi:hypothetical protein
MAKPEIREVIPLPPDETAVLDRMVDFRGNPLRKTLMNEIIQNEIRLIMPYGAPRSGKTTFAHQLGVAIEQDSYGMKSAELMLFDDAIKEAQERLGLGPISDWDSEWTAASDYYHQKIEERLAELPRNQVLIAENVAAGQTDRGVTTLRKLAAGHKVDAFFVAIVSDPRISERATQMRRRILETDDSGNFTIPDDQVLSFLENYHLLVDGTEGFDPAYAGRIIRDAMGSMDPMKDTPVTARTLPEEDRMTTQAETERKKGFGRGRHRPPERHEVRTLGARGQELLAGGVRSMPEEVMKSGLSVIEVEDIRVQREFFEAQQASLHLRTRVSPHRLITAYNPLVEDQVIHYLDIRELMQAA